MHTVKRKKLPAAWGHQFGSRLRCALGVGRAGVRTRRTLGCAGEVSEKEMAIAQPPLSLNDNAPTERAGRVEAKAGRTRKIGPRVTQRPLVDLSAPILQNHSAPPETR